MEKRVKKTRKITKTKKKTKRLTKAQLKEQKRAQFPKAERVETDKKELNLKLNRAIGQLNGIKKMIEEDRVCDDILIQISAVKSAVEAVKYSLLKELFADMPQYKEAVENKFLEKVLSKIKKY